ncbi:MAG: hypothetical protein BIP78_1425 [Candidatus Bipolaricaulis sibiricus]|uniref:Uncharacterized protein n=1 Tax=Bipolaricaulis sibiricus TaxID=2501609 RepID=A0A410FW58_BIPS1|nr:MAG: hypothetical protein BIP78_1425 [Candidatus Bipolaricaulis sibiricus]
MIALLGRVLSCLPVAPKELDMGRRDDEKVCGVPVSPSLNFQAGERCPRRVLRLTTCEGA